MDTAHVARSERHKPDESWHGARDDRLPWQRQHVSVMINVLGSGEWKSALLFFCRGGLQHTPSPLSHSLSSCRRDA